MPYSNIIRNGLTHFFLIDSLSYYGYYHLEKVGAFNMNISIDEKAARWFTDEFQNNLVRMFPQYDGFGEKNKGFSLAFSAEAPTNIGFLKEINGIRLYVEGNDVWFFEDTETWLSYNDEINEIQISFK
jgi:uncharacterized protein YneR